MPTSDTLGLRSQRLSWLDPQRAPQRHRARRESGEKHHGVRAEENEHGSRGAEAEQRGKCAAEENAR